MFPTEIYYDDPKNFIVLVKLVKGIKDNFDEYVGCCVTNVDDIDFYYPGFTNLYNTLKRFRSKIIPRGRNNVADEIVDTYIPRGFYFYIILLIQNLFLGQNYFEVEKMI